LPSVRSSANWAASEASAIEPGRRPSPGERQVGEQHAGVDRHVVDALARLVGDRLQQHLGAQVLDPIDALQRLVDRHGADRHLGGGEDRLARRVDPLAGREVHHRVGAPALGERQLLDLLRGPRGGRRGADVGVDLDPRREADRHRVEPPVVDVGGDHHPSPRHLLADQLGVEAFAGGDPLDLGRDDPGAGEVHLGAAGRVGRERAAVLGHVCSPFAGMSQIRFVGWWS